MTPRDSGRPLRPDERSPLQGGRRRRPEPHRRRRALMLLGLVALVAATAAYATGTDDDPSGAAARSLRLTSLVAHAPSLKPLSRSPLPANLLIADRGNNRLLIVNPNRQVIWRFPRPGDLRAGQQFNVPDDAFFTADGKRIVATEEDDFVVSVIDIASHRIVYRYGTPGVPGAGPNQLYNPDDALPLPDGRLMMADIKNCRVITIRPPAHAVESQLGQGGTCQHDPPAAFGSPNGAFPMAGGGTVVTEINGDWIDVLDRHGRLVSTANPPGFSYPSDTNEVRPGLFLSVDYVANGAIETFDAAGRLRWRYAPTGSAALNQPSLALPLPNGDVVANDDHNHRVIVVDPRTDRVVWQYGHTGTPGTADGYLNIPDGVDLAPPFSLAIRFAPTMTAP